MIAKLLLQNTILIVAIGALLFAAAGSLQWPAAWVKRALVEGLPDYADYAARVRYRLLPGLW